MKTVTQSWKQKHLSHGGKEVLLKAIAVAMPIFSMNIFRLPKEICSEINAILAKFWWGSGDKKGLHWYSWNRISVPKREGGLGFKDLEIFNQALLSKQVWRIMQNPNCLMARILKARYFSDGDILKAKLKKKASYAWKSILHGRDLITKGMRYIIGDGELINMWTDPWIPDHPPRPPHARGDFTEGEKVKEYFDANRLQWNEGKLREVVIDEDVERILALRISPTAKQDLMGWHYNEDGLYTVKSGYWLGTHLPTNTLLLPTHGSADLKKKIWKTKVPAKLQHFLWRLSSRCLATGSNLRRRHITRNGQCKRCCMAEETEEHLFFECPYAIEIWRASGVSNLTINSPTTSLEEKIDACLQYSLSTRLTHFQDLPIWILWRIWKGRNVLVFQQRETPWRSIIRYAKEDAKKWKQNDVAATTSYRERRRCIYNSSNVKWTRPPQGWKKCNIDGSYHQSRATGTAGWIIRDENGVYKGSAHARGRRVQDALECELQAILMALQHCWSLGHRKVIMETDCQKAVEIINNKKLHFAYYNWTRDIRWWAAKYQSISFQWINRDANKVADCLAKRVENETDFKFYYYVPQYLHSLLHADHISSS